MDFLLPFFLFLFSILAIGKGSDWLTDSLIPVARKLGVTRSFVGLILVSIAVSLPEVFVAVYATIAGYPAISLGVILGSIACNIGLMSGVSSFVKPLKVSNTIILRDGVFSLIVPILVFAVAAGGLISRLEGFAFVLLFIPYIINVYLHEKHTSAEVIKEHTKEIEIELGLLGFDFGKIKSGWLSFILGLFFLLIGAQIFGSQLIRAAQNLGINELLIGLTLGAIGPSIPNILAAYKAAQRGMGDIVVSETLGSNIFTLLVTLGISAMVSPIVISKQWIIFDLPAIIVMSLLLFIFIMTGKVITKKEGLILIGGYLSIILIQIGMNW